jgi:hypothetical protein
MKKLLALLAVVLIAAAYVAGAWPERQRRLALEGEVQILDRRVEEAEARVRMGTLLGELQNLMETVGQKNYGQAQPLSSAFFDHARAETGRTPQPAFRDALEGVLAVRDPVTASLAQGDPAVMEQLRKAERRLKDALGYAPPAPAPVPAPSPTPEPGLSLAPSASPAPSATPTPTPTPVPTPTA